MDDELIPSAIQFDDNEPIEHPCQLCLVRPACKRTFLTCGELREYLILFLCAKAILDKKGTHIIKQYFKYVSITYDLDIDLNSKSLKITLDP